jgi:hypothetical protein
MGEDGIDLLARLEKLEKRFNELQERVDNPKTKIYTDKFWYICKPPYDPINLYLSRNACDHNYPITESTGGRICSNCGKVMGALFAPRETTGFRMHL